MLIIYKNLALHALKGDTAMPLKMQSVLYAPLADITAMMVNHTVHCVQIFHQLINLEQILLIIVAAMKDTTAKHSLRNLVQLAILYLV